MRVAAGNPDASYLVRKIERRRPASRGGRMPLGGVPLDPTLIANVRTGSAKVPKTIDGEGLNATGQRTLFHSTHRVVDARMLLAHGNALGRSSAPTARYEHVSPPTYGLAHCSQSHRVHSELCRAVWCRARRDQMVGSLALTSDYIQQGLSQTQGSKRCRCGLRARSTNAGRSVRGLPDRSVSRASAGAPRSTSMRPAPGDSARIGSRR